MNCNTYCNTSDIIEHALARAGYAVQASGELTRTIVPWADRERAERELLQASSIRAAGACIHLTITIVRGPR